MADEQNKEDWQPTECEAAAERFFDAMQASPDANHAFQVLLTLTVMALEGNSAVTQTKFIHLIAKQLGLRSDPVLTEPEVPIKTKQQHAQYIYLAGWNPAEREPN